MTEERPEGPAAAVSRARPVMGTLARITSYDEAAEPAIDAALARMAGIEAKVGPGTGSQVAKLNSLAGAGAVRLDPDVWRILNTAVRFSRLTGGAFDITAGPLIDLWGFGYGGAGRRASPGEVRHMLSLVGWKHLLLDPAGRSARLALPGMRLAMGGIAKGYAVEAAARVLRGNGVRNALINCGNSSLKVLGEGPRGRGWRIALEDPRRPGRAFGLVTLHAGQALASSADDKRCFIEDGRRFSHLIDPRTGRPAAVDVQHVTVITRNATAADILSTAFFLQGTAWSMAFARAKRIGFLAADARERVLATPDVLFN